MKSVAACGSWHLCFCFGRPAKREGEHREDLQRGRVITATEKRGEIEANALCWTPCQCWADHQTFYRAIRFYWLAAAAVLHFKPNLKLLFWQKNWNFDALRETGARAFSIAKFAVNKDVHCPLDQVGKVVRDQQREFNRILR